MWKVVQIMEQNTLKMSMTLKKIVFPEQETSPESSLHDSLVNNEGPGNRKVNNCSSAKYLKVDNRLRLHKKEPTISGSSHQSKRVLAIPVPEKKHTCNGQKKTNCKMRKNINISKSNREINMLTENFK